MLTGYVLVMAYLALGLRLLRRPERATPARTGWPALIRRVAGTAAGGYLLLVAVAAGYDRWVAHPGGGFVASAVTGGALLTALALPAFLAATWLCTRRKDRR